MSNHQYPGLDIDDDPKLQEHEWVLQRIAWVIFIVLLAGIALGLLGRGGPLSTVKKTAQDGSFQMEFDRFVRKHSSDKLRFKITPTGNTVRMKVDSGYIQDVQIDTVTPQPREVVSEGGALTFVFDTRPSEPMAVTIHLLPDKVGRLQGWISVDDHAREPLNQFVYP